MTIKPNAQSLTFDEQEAGECHDGGDQAEADEKGYRNGVGDERDGGQDGRYRIVLQVMQVFLVERIQRVFVPSRLHGYK